MIIKEQIFYADGTSEIRERELTEKELVALETPDDTVTEG